MSQSHKWSERLTPKSARNCLFCLFKQKWIVLMNGNSLMSCHMTCQQFFQCQPQKVFICLLFGYSCLKIIEGQGHQHNTSHCGRGEARCAHTSPQERRTRPPPPANLPLALPLPTQTPSRHQWAHTLCKRGGRVASLNSGLPGQG